jgi:hypothetical protein
MTRNQLTDEQMQDKLTELNAQDSVENARIVEFMGNEHIHVDYQSGDIGTVSPDGSDISVVQC